MITGKNHVSQEKKLDAANKLVESIGHASKPEGGKRGRWEEKDCHQHTG
jgi:hypothetical protein